MVVHALHPAFFGGVSNSSLDGSDQERDISHPKVPVYFTMSIEIISGFKVPDLNTTSYNADYIDPKPETGPRMPVPSVESTDPALSQLRS